MRPLVNKSCIFCVVLIFFCPAVTALGRVIHVDDDGPADFNNIQAAINDANERDTIIVGDGMYTGDGNRDIDFEGKAITVRSENGPESCVVDCQGTQADCHRGFTFHSGEDANSILTGFTITNGYGPVDYVGNSPQLAGGAIYCSASSPSISNCIMTGNSAAAGGAVCCSHGARPQIVNCRLTYNFGQGGAINCRDSAPEIVNCVVADNQAPWYCDPLGMWCLDVYGGGFYCSNCRATIRNCTIVGNWASGEGDGLYTYGLKPILRNCILCTGPDEIAGSGAIMTYSTFSCAVAFTEWGYLDPNGTPDDPTDDFYVRGDYHLKSQAGRWEPKSQSWVQDDVTSPCIDAGDPMCPIGYEPFPNGGLINMGAYGGTAEASKSYFGEPVCETIVAGDLNGDCRVNFGDFAILAAHWMECNAPEVQVQVTDVKIIKGELVEGWFEEIQEVAKLRIGDVFLIRAKVSNLGCGTVNVLNLYGWDLSPANYVDVIGDSAACAAVYRLEPGESASLGPFCPSQAFRAKQDGLMTMNIYEWDWMGNILYEYTFNFEILPGE